MDNPISWLVLTVLVILGIIYLWNLAMKEKRENDRLNDRFFWDLEHGYRDR